MNHLIIKKSPVQLDLKNYNLNGEPVVRQERKLKDVEGIFKNKDVLKTSDKEQPVYSVQAWLPVTEGKTGGLFFGTSTLFPGKVGDEYFMTKGHFHSESDRAEFYWGIQGSGMLILMDRERNTWGEEVFPGSLHYIGGHIAHRLANTGNVKMIVGACWPSDAGHDYDEIAKNGFSARLMEVNKKPKLINEE